MRTDPDHAYAYFVNGEAWWSSSVPHGRDGVMIQRAHRNGGVAWEFRIDEHDLSGATLQLHMFGDSWDAFADVPELFAALRTERPSTLVDLRALLDRLRFQDVTERQRGQRVELAVPR